MSDEKRYTEREYVLGLRSAFKAGAEWIRRTPIYTSDRAIANAVTMTYPLPKVTRPRVVRLGNYDYRIVNGVVQCLFGGTWQESSIHTVYGTRVIADLIANPTETVSAE